MKMAAFWDEADFDDHEVVHFVSDRASGLNAIIAIHSTHCGPAAGGTRFWHYEDSADGMRDALRLSRGMSYKNAMANLPGGGGKAVILADKNRTKTPEMLTAFAKAVDDLGGKYITAQDVGMSEQDMVALSQVTGNVAGLPGDGGGDPGPFTARGVFLGVQAAAKHALAASDMKGVRVAIQGVGSVGGGLARYLADAGAELTLADIDAERAGRMAEELGGNVASSEGKMLLDRGILYAPDYVINAGGIITVLRKVYGADDEGVNARIDQIPERLESIWAECEANGLSADEVADGMARKLIGR
jgi:leucine dehydrogenase